MNLKEKKRIHDKLGITTGARRDMRSIGIT